MYFSRYVVLFIAYSLLGWVFETVYCSIHESKWENRGFLHGPICPIYGTGAVAISILFEYLPVSQAASLTNWQIFLIGYFGSIVLEYSTSWFLEKKFHAVWWDYSDMPFNINGRICLPASVLFGLAGILVIRVLYPVMSGMTGHMSPLLTEGLALALMALLGADTALTVSALTNFEKELNTIEDNINQHMAYFVNNIAEKTLDAEIMIEEERERFARQNILRLTDRLEPAKLSALRRIKHYSPVVLSEKRFSQLSRIHDFIKDNTNFRKKAS